MHHPNNQLKQLQFSFSPHPFTSSVYNGGSPKDGHSYQQTSGVCTSRPPITRGDGPSIARGNAGPYSIFGFLFLSDLVVTGGYFMYRRFNIKQFYILPRQCIYVFCMNVRTLSDYFPAEHELISLYKPNKVYVLFGKI